MCIYFESSPLVGNFQYNTRIFCLFIIYSNGAFYSWTFHWQKFGLDFCLGRFFELQVWMKPIQFTWSLKEANDHMITQYKYHAPPGCVLRIYVLNYSPHYQNSIIHLLDWSLELRGFNPNLNNKNKAGL